MELEEKITHDLKAALKAKDELKVSCLRMLKTSLKNLQVEKRRGLKEEEVQAVIASHVKKAKEAAEEFRKGGRQDLAEKEGQEAQILLTYLPRQLGPEEIEAILKEIIQELSASGPKDLGRVMKAAMARMAGQAQGKEVNEIARRLLF